MLIFTSKPFAQQLVLEHLLEKHNRGLELRVGRQVAVEEGSYEGFTARRTCVCGWDTSTSVGYPAACHEEYRATPRLPRQIQYVRAEVLAQVKAPAETGDVAC